MAHRKPKWTVHCRNTAAYISYQVLQSTERWLRLDAKVEELGVIASFDLLRLYMSGVPVIAE